MFVSDRSRKIINVFMLKHQNVSRELLCCGEKMSRASIHSGVQIDTNFAFARLNLSKPGSLCAASHSRPRFVMSGMDLSFARLRCERVFHDA